MSNFYFSINNINKNKITFIHFEFQTTNKGKTDLRRFRAYEALPKETIELIATDIFELNSTIFLK